MWKTHQTGKHSNTNSRIQNHPMQLLKTVFRKYFSDIYRELFSVISFLSKERVFQSCVQLSMTKGWGIWTIFPQRIWKACGLLLTFLQTAGSQKSEFEGYPLIPDDTFLSKATCAGTNAAGGACLACPYVRIGILLASSSRSAWDSWLTWSLSPPIPTVGRRTTA